MNSGSGRFAICRVNPVWWFVFAFILLLAGIALAHCDKFRFNSFHFITISWMGAGLLTAHISMNLKNYRKYISGKKIKYIPKSILLDMFQYLPYLLMALFYDNIPLFQNVVNTRFYDFDRYLMTADECLFGVQPTLLLEEYLNPYLVEFFMFSYTLFVLPYVFLMYLFQKGEKTVFNKMLLAQVIASIIALSCFIYLPAKGPRYVFAPYNSHLHQNMPRFEKQIEGVRIDALSKATGYESFYHLQYDVWNSLERIKTDCIPSMHTALYLLCLMFVIRYRTIMKWKYTAMIFWSVSCASLMFSCVYLRYHWAMDVFAGIIAAFISYMIAESIIDRLPTTVCKELLQRRGR
jgi:membrane-associated phospholipid phosphatase